MTNKKFQTRFFQYLRRDNIKWQVAATLKKVVATGTSSGEVVALLTKAGCTFRRAEAYDGQGWATSEGYIVDVPMSGRNSSRMCWLLLDSLLDEESYTYGTWSFELVEKFLDSRPKGHWWADSYRKWYGHDFSH